MRGISHLEAKPGATLIDTCFLRGGSRSRAEASISRSNPSRSSGTDERPRSVSCRPRASHEQRPADDVFQQTDLLADRAGRDRQLVGGAREVQMPRGGLKGAQGVEREQGTGHRG